MKKAKGSLSQKAILGILIIVFPLITTFFVIFARNKAYLEKRITDTLTVIADVYEGQIYQFLEMSVRRAQDFASDGFIRTQLLKRIRGRKISTHLLSNHLVKNKMVLDKSVVAIQIVSLEGKVVASTNRDDIGRDVSSLAFFVKGKDGVSVIENCKCREGEPELAISAPVFTKDTGERIGVIANFIHLSEVGGVLSGKYQQHLGAISWDKGIEEWNTLGVCLVNKEKLMIASSISMKDVFLKQRAETQPVELALSEGKEMSGIYNNYRGVKVIGASMYIPSTKWVLLVEVERSEILAPLKRKVLSSASMAIAVAVTTMVTLLVIFLKKVVKPVRVIADAAQKIALGEYETVITVDANDEIGVLGESFNAMSRDISARTAALMKSNESLAEAQRIARLGNWEWDIVKNELFWSDEIYRIFGLLPREFEATYEAFLQCVHPDDREYVKKSVNDALFAKKPYEINHRILLQDASVRIVHEKASVVFGDEGKAIRMVGTVQDVTEQKSLETQLRKLSSAIEQSPNTVVITDTKGDIQYVNPTFLAKTGYTLEEVMGQNPRVLKSGLMPDEVYKRLWETVSAGGVWQGELCNKKKNGELYWELVHISPLRNTEGVITSYLALKDDITAIRRAEDEKKALREQLFHSQKMESVGKLAGGIAHDFNNILTAISGYGSLLEMEAKEGTPSREYVRKILSSVERAVNLVQGMLTFSRKKDSDLKPEDVNAIVRNVEDLLIRLIGEKVKLVIALADKECVVVADSGQIEQVLMNLAANARDAMPEGGSLFISTGIVKLDHEFIKLHKYGKVGLYGVISVSDTGMGMDEKTKSRIFEPFFTTKEVGKGTGLGLAIVYGIMKQHDGHINVYSEPGKGTTFKMYLPMAASRAVREEQQELQPVAGGRETILLADDDGDVRDVIASVLKGSGYKVIEAINGEDALHKFNDNKENIQLLVVDVMMPGKNGREVYDEIRKARPDMRTLFMSGYAEEVISETIILEEGLNFISKPVSPAGMLRKVRTVLDT